MWETNNNSALEAGVTELGCFLTPEAGQAPRNVWLPRQQGKRWTLPVSTHGPPPPPEAKSLLTPGDKARRKPTTDFTLDILQGNLTPTTHTVAMAPTNLLLLNRIRKQPVFLPCMQQHQPVPAESQALPGPPGWQSRSRQQFLNTPFLGLGFYLLHRGAFQLAS